MCVVFFVIRPRLAKRMAAASEGLSKELMGRQPLMYGVAQFEGSTDPDRAGFKGVGALAVTDQAIVFVSGTTQSSLIIPRTALISAVPATSFAAPSKTIRRPRPMLVITWQARKRAEVSVISDEPGQQSVADHSAPSIALSVDDAMRWLAVLAETAPPATADLTGHLDKVHSDDEAGA